MNVEVDVNMNDEMNVKMNVKMNARDSSAFSWKRGRRFRAAAATAVASTGTTATTPIAAGETVLSGGNDGNVKNLKACTGECEQRWAVWRGTRVLSAGKGGEDPVLQQQGGGKNWTTSTTPSTRRPRRLSRWSRWQP